MSKAEISHEVKPESSFSSPSSLDITTLVSKIESMDPLQKKAFCRTLSSSEKKAYINYLRDRDAEEVEVVFRCFEPMGGMVKFTAYPYQGVGGTYELFDNVKYKIPICIAKRFNNEFQGIGTFYPTHAYIVDAQGHPVIGVGKRNYRFGANSPFLV